MRTTLLGLILMHYGLTAVQADEIEWIGLADSSFRNPANWAGGLVPGQDDVALITRGQTEHELTFSESDSIRLAGLQIGSADDVRGEERVFASGGEVEVGRLVLDARDGDTALLQWRAGTIRARELVLLSSAPNGVQIRILGGELQVGSEGIALQSTTDRGVDIELWRGQLDLTEAGASIFREPVGTVVLDISDGTLRVPGDVRDVQVLSDALRVAPTSLGVGCRPWIAFTAYDYDDRLDATEITAIDGLLPGDADQDGDFSQLDLLRVLRAGKYLSGLPATWGEGDWNGWRQYPQKGDGFFNQLDVIEALNGNCYLCGFYCAVGPDLSEPSRQWSVTAIRAPQSSPVPEPSSCFFLALGVICLWRRNGQNHCR